VELPGYVLTELSHTGSTSRDAATKRSSSSPASVKLALVSCGLGNTKRGFETSTARWFEALRKYTDLDVRLYCGGDYPGGKRLWNFPRNSIWSKWIHSVPFMPERSRWEWTYGVEQVSFWSALNFELLDWRPDVVWVKDYPLAHLLATSRIMFGLDFKLIFANGGLPDPSTYKEFDFIQQIQKDGYEKAMKMGVSGDRMELITNCVPSMDVDIDRDAYRKLLGLEENDWAILCVAAWNRYHKRIDYLLEEVARLNDPHAKLILLGTPEVDAPSLQEQGRQLLGDRVKWMTVDVDTVPKVMKACDVFVLPTLEEHLGNALIEAAMSGMPVVTHPHDGAKFSVRDEFWMTDLSQSGNLAERLTWLRNNRESLGPAVAELKTAVASRFGEEVQAAKFADMVKRTMSVEGAKQKASLKGSTATGAM